jgi:hypothetical protein
LSFVFLFVFVCYILYLSFVFFSYYLMSYCQFVIFLLPFKC